MQPGRNLQDTPQKRFLHKLRADTSSLHNSLEELSISKNLTADNATLSDYTCYLQAMYGVVKDAEQNIYPLLEDVIPDVNDRLKLASLESDIKNIDEEVYNKTVFPIEAKKNDVPFLLGIMYVVEGSALGGRVILKNLSEQIKLSQEVGTSYFTGYGERTGEMWKAFVEKMSNYAVANSVEDEIIDGANCAFRAIYDHLSEFSK